MFGPRRYGKSSLLFRAAQLLAPRRVLVAYVDLMATPTKERFAGRLAQAIHEDVATPLIRARERAVSVFRSLRVQPTITINPHDAGVSFRSATDREEASAGDTRP